VSCSQAFSIVKSQNSKEIKLQFGSHGLVWLLTVRFTVTELSRIIGSVHKFMVWFGYFRFGSQFSSVYGFK
jgi:hypothetical protein